MLTNLQFSIAEKAGEELDEKRKLKKIKITEEENIEKRIRDVIAE